jgi:hypothetical protein
VKARVLNASGAVCAFVLTVFVGWYDGVDFLVRGKDQVFWTSEALLAAIAAYLFLRTKFSPAYPALGPRWARVVATVAAVAIVFAEAWYGGASLLERGHGQGAIFYMAAVVGFICWTCPLWMPIGSARSKRSL